MVVVKGFTRRIKPEAQAGGASPVVFRRDVSQVNAAQVVKLCAEATLIAGPQKAVSS